METLPLIIIFSLVGGALSTVGKIVLMYRNKLDGEASIHLISFAAGTLLAAVFFDLLPEASEMIAKNGGKSTSVFLFAFIGLLTFFVIEGLLFRLHHHHHTKLNEDPCAVKDTTTSRAPLFLSIGDGIHNFIDGIAITAAFLINVPLGITTSLAVAAHEVPQEISEFAIMLRGGWTRRQVLFWNLAVSLTTTFGALMAFVARDVLLPYIGYLIALAAGLFIYIATADLMPDLYHCSRRGHIARTISVFLLGVASVFVLTNLLKV